ncbi:PucR family transcriptional regulator [Burkholderia vietnamiensis]|uniref:PucR family transcriptional regulator n=1 Tax=Burkholderia vietnamiensis TaxID=60552 RepID=UPI001D148E2F|nr:helix-turn-helix domain-containing protein [Burkholderia vietnamiensis]UEC01790.1 helix-turn-helix domain-containing protein [Burkholderia vietnamiensis]
MFERAGVNIGDLLDSLVTHGVQLVAPPAYDNMTVEGIAIADPDEIVDAAAGLLVMLIGVRGKAAIPVLRALARGTPVVIAVKGIVAEFEQVAEELTLTGVGLIVVGEKIRWETFEVIVRRRLSEVELRDTKALADPKDLFSIADATATLIGGHVVIDDPTCRMLAYSAINEEVDDQRRLTILARQGPKSYMQHLAASGVFQRVRETEGPVYVEARPELGIRRRMVIGIRANDHFIGHIWVLEGKIPFTAQSEEALIGAARHVSTTLAKHRNDDLSSLRENRIASLLGEPSHVRAVARTLDIDEGLPASLALISIRNSSLGSTHFQSKWGELVNMVAIRVAAYRENAVVGQLDGYVVIVLPMLDPIRAPQTIRRLVGDSVRALRSHFRVSIQGIIGPTVDSLLNLGEAYGKTRRAFHILATGPDEPLAVYDEMIEQVLLNEIFELMQNHMATAHPGLEHLIRTDPEMAGTLLAYLEAFGDANAVAESQKIHRNTVRYRARRAGELTGLDLSNPDHRLTAQLLLRRWKMLKH